MATGSSKRSTKTATRTQLRVSSARAAARTISTAAREAAAKPGPDRYRKWASFVVDSHGDFGYGAYFAGGEPQS
jgi:hypothetical protein